MSSDERQSWSAEEVVPLLKKVALFEGLADDDLSRIADLVTGTTLDEGEILFEEGDPGEAFYIVCDGAVEIVKVQGESEEKLAIRRSGDGFGEMALLDDAPRSATARALEESQLMVIKQEDFEGLLEGDTLATRMLTAISRALRALNVRFAAMERRLQPGGASVEEMSRLVQRGLLPRNVPKVEGYDLAAGTSLPPSSRGRTIWDWFPMEGGRTALTVLQIQGEGLPPVHQCSQARALLRELARDHGSPEELLGRVNHALTEIAIEGVDQVVECGLAVLDGQELVWAGAGPIPAGVVTRDGELKELTSHGPALGMMAGFGYSAEQLEMGTGDSLLAISKGGLGLLKGASDLVAGRRGKPAGGIVSTLHQAVQRARGEKAADLSVLFIRRQ